MTLSFQVPPGGFRCATCSSIRCEFNYYARPGPIAAAGGIRTRSAAPLKRSTHGASVQSTGVYDPVNAALCAKSSFARVIRIGSLGRLALERESTPRRNVINY